MEPPPFEDPGVGNRPLGALALATAAVRHLRFLVYVLIMLTQTCIRSNVLTRCTPLVISLLLANSSTLSSGAQRP